MEGHPRNVLGEPLEVCSRDPMTGFYRDGCCRTGPEDLGSHTVCVRMTQAFLAFSRSCGNDLSTPRHEFGFPGLMEGDQWCLCAPRWKEALDAGAAPRVVLAAHGRIGAGVCESGRPETVRDRPRMTGARGDSRLRRPHVPEISPKVGVQQGCRPARQGCPVDRWLAAGSAALRISVPPALRRTAMTHP